MSTLENSALIEYFIDLGYTAEEITSLLEEHEDYDEIEQDEVANE